MHLSEDLQKALKAIGSVIEPDRVLTGELPANYAFFHSEKRNFHVDYWHAHTSYAVTLLEVIAETDYTLVSAKIILENIYDVALLLSEWVEHQKMAKEIKKRFGTLEIFEPLPSTNPNPLIEERWRRIQNGIFRQSWGRDREWEQKRLHLLWKAKMHPAFINYYPFSSHWSLRFSLNSEITYTWSLDYLLDLYEQNGNYVYGVTLCFETGEKKLFAHATEALDFYAQLLATHKPVQWNAR